MTGLMNPLTKTEFARPNAGIYSSVEIDWIDGTKKYGGVVGGLNSDANGAHASKVIDFGQSSRTASGTGNSLSYVTKNIKMIDDDYEFSNRVGKGQRIEFSPIRVYWNSSKPGVPRFQSYGGVIDSYDISNPQDIVLTCSSPYHLLKKKFPYKLVDYFTWPNCDKTALGKLVPLCYGLHDDSGLFDSGPIQPLYVDTVGFQYLVCVGWAKPLRVYSSGVILATSAWTTVYTVRNGFLYTLIKLTITGGTNSITCDVLGYETIGDGTGTPIMSIVDQFQHMIVNFGFLKYGFQGTTKWVVGVGSAPIDTTRNTTTKTALLGRAQGMPYAGSRYVDTFRTLEQECNDLSISSELYPMWSNLGLLGLYFDNPNQVQSNIDVVRHPTDYLAPIKFKNQAATTDVRRSTICSFSSFRTTTSAKTNVQGALRGATFDPQTYQQLEVDDPNSTSPNEDQQSYTWQPASFP